MASLESSIRWADGFLLLYSITQRLTFLDLPPLKTNIDKIKQSLGRQILNPLPNASSFFLTTKRHKVEVFWYLSLHRNLIDSCLCHHTFNIMSFLEVAAE